MTTLTFKETINLLNKDTDLSISSVAYWLYENYDRVTGDDLDVRDDEMHFPDLIEDVIEHFDFDYDDFSQEWGA